MSQRSDSTRPPSILWIMTDEQRTDSLGCYGSPWARTPNLDALAAGGALFRNAVTPSPVCVPARTSMLTGAYPHETGVWCNGVATHEYRPLTQPFIDAGYRTASFGKRHYISPDQAFEDETSFELSDAVSYFGYSDQYSQRDYDVVQYPPEPYPWIFGGRFPEPEERTSEARCARLALEWLESHPPDVPYLLRVSFNGPHTPVAPPEPFDRIIDEDSVSFPEELDGLPPDLPRWIGESLLPMIDASRLTRDEIRAMRRYYYGMVSYIDSVVGRLLNGMNERNQLDNTIIVVTSDHGTHLGDYNLVQKQTFFNNSVNVPFIVHWPGRVAAGAQFETPVETRGLLPTLLGLTGMPVPDDLTAVDYTSALCTGLEPMDRPVFSELTLGSFRIRHEDRLIMVRARGERGIGGHRADWKYCVCLDEIDGDPSLYDLVNDPLELENLAGQSALEETERSLRRLIDEHIAGGTAPSS
jgi:arylsulfatase